MNKLRIALMLLFMPTLVSAGIYRCVIDGVAGYQGHPCPSSADRSDDVSHLQSTPHKYQEMVPEAQIYRDYRSDVKENREDFKAQRFLRERKLEAAENKRSRDRALDKANAYNEQQRREKAQRDQKWSDDRDKRKARNNGTYEYLEIKTN